MRSYVTHRRGNAQRPQEHPSLTEANLNRSSSHRNELEKHIETLPPAPDFEASLRKPGRRIIAELKRTSPSEGLLRSDVDPVSIAEGYESVGAAAISVLTEPTYFDGSLADLELVSSRIGMPCLRKDFILDEIQILEARAAGASAYLLIVAALDDHQLQKLLTFGQNLGLAPLVEVHTAEELKRAIDLDASIIGVNNRNLNTLQIDLKVSAELREFIPDETVAVAESGIDTPDDLHMLQRAGYNAFLIGSSIMKAASPAQHLHALIHDIRT